MGRKKMLIIYPKLNDYDGDLKKKWYVEYSFRLTDDDEMHRFRHYLCASDAKTRRKQANEIILKIRDYLKSGEYLNHNANYSPVRDCDSHRQEQKRFKKIERSHKVRSVVEDFIKYGTSHWREKTISTYSSKLFLFTEYVEKNLSNKSIAKIERKDLLPFFNDVLARERELCHVTINKYEKCLHALFDYCENMEIIPYNSNPVIKMPNYGKKVDYSPDIFTKSDRERLKDAIQHSMPFLWLACEIQYYCAIRPGMELRLLKIKDIDRNRKIITIPADIAKNKTTQSVGIPDRVLQLMEALGIFQYSGDLYVFGRNGCPGHLPFGKNTMRNHFNKFRDALHISKEKKFYSWKHTGAISSYDNGMPITELKDHLRHSSIMTTEEYLKKHKPKLDSVGMYIDDI